MENCMVNTHKGEAEFFALISVFVIGIIAIVGAGMFGLPKYNVWRFKNSPELEDAIDRYFANKI